MTVYQKTTEHLALKMSDENCSRGMLVISTKSCSREQKRHTSWSTLVMLWLSCQIHTWPRFDDTSHQSTSASLHATNDAYLLLFFFSFGRVRLKWQPWRDTTQPSAPAEKIAPNSCLVHWEILPQHPESFSPQSPAPEQPSLLSLYQQYTSGASSSTSQVNWLATRSNPSASGVKGGVTVSLCSRPMLVCLQRQPLRHPVPEWPERHQKDKW